jgi:O-antigen ligase
MSTTRIAPLPFFQPSERWALPFAGIVVASLLGAIVAESVVVAAIPFGLLALWLAFVDFKALFFLLMATIPISTEVELPGGFGTDLFSEPLMWLLTLTGTVWLCRNYRSIDGRFLRHPITLFLLVHLVWTTIAVVFSQNFTISLKFLLAKGWYVIVFYFLAGRFLTSHRDVRRFVWWFFVPLVITAITVLYRQYGKGFAFDSVNSCLSPFYRNHVMYACIMAVFIPFLWYATYWYKRGSLRWLALVLGIVVLLVGINFAYTRAAYGALVAGIAISILVRFRAIKLGLWAASILMALFIAFVTYRDNWLLFAPDFERTITHTRFESLLEATTRLEDISVMERVYRWVAASQMMQERPLLGFGPGNFYFTYKDYTVSSFRTYVSDNPERSGMHNYYLMTAVEQGVPGAAIFIALCFFAMVQGQRIYHRVRAQWRKDTVLASILCLALIVILMLMNDFVETDKIGSLFFMSLALMVGMDLGNTKTMSKNSGVEEENYGSS